MNYGSQLNLEHDDAVNVEELLKSSVELCKNASSYDQETQTNEIISDFKNSYDCLEKVIEIYALTNQKTKRDDFMHFVDGGRFIEPAENQLNIRDATLQGNKDKVIKTFALFRDFHTSMVWDSSYAVHKGLAETKSRYDMHNIY